MSETKECRMCKQHKPCADFHKSGSSKDGLYRICKSCRSISAKASNEKYRDKLRKKGKEYREKNKEKCRERTRQWRKSKGPGLKDFMLRSRLASKYKTTPEIVSVLMEEQGNACSICGGDFGKRGPQIDHDHATGKMRGFLCVNCNLALGFFKDDMGLMRAAIAYLEKYDGHA